jgi:hypothetical protein
MRNTPGGDGLEAEFRAYTAPCATWTPSIVNPFEVSNGSLRRARAYSEGPFSADTVRISLRPIVSLNLTAIGAKCMFNNLKIGMRLAIGFGTVLALLAVIAAVGA